MPWLPLGPDMVYWPRNMPRRLSRRNELGTQGLPSNIALDPADPDTIYIVERPSSGGQSAWRTRDGGRSWKCIADVLQRLNPNTDPAAIAVNPRRPEIIYLATWGSRQLFVSNDRGDTWGPANAVGGNVIKLLIDPRTASDPSRTVLLAATNIGIRASRDGGVTWTTVQRGDISSLIANFPDSGPAQFYAGVRRSGLFYTTDLFGRWTNLNDQSIGLAPYMADNMTPPAPANFDMLLVELCPLNPNRLYLWATRPTAPFGDPARGSVTAGLFTTSSPLTAWTPVSASSLPDPASGLYGCKFAVAPNSPGDGARDVLLFGRVGLHRSIDAGRNWSEESNSFHADMQSFAFFPARPAAGRIPLTYLGCDGGIAVSTRLADPAYDITAVVTDFNESSRYADTGLWQNLNHGRQASAVYSYGADPVISALSYICCQDTGVNGGTASLGWRSLANADAGGCAVTRGEGGVVIWTNYGSLGGWADFRLRMFTDTGGASSAAADVQHDPSNSLVVGTSNIGALLNNNGIAGGIVRDSPTTLSSAITPQGMPGAELPQAATPASMTGIIAGRILIMGSGMTEESVTVLDTTASTFRAVFTKAHAAGEPILHQRAFVCRLNQQARAFQISQDVGINGGTIALVACHPTDPDVLYAIAVEPSTPFPRNQRLITTTSASAANASTAWSEITRNKPSDFKASSLTVDRNGDVFVMMRQPMTTMLPGGASITSPLFKVSGDSWSHLPCLNVPTGNFADGNLITFGKIVAHPITPGVLFAFHGARVYRVRFVVEDNMTFVRSGWKWEDFSDGLPGGWVYDLWAGDISGGVGANKILLRAAIPTRGTWELDVTDDAASPDLFLYLRDNLLDNAWLPRSPENVPNPYAPNERVWHYQCADIKLDSRQPGTPDGPDYYQTEPEGETPLNHVSFDELTDNSQQLVFGERAQIHVQVHNRGARPAGNVRVWAIVCNAAAGLPALNASLSMGNTFNFWAQFSATGEIIPSLPADSPWRSVGSPRTLPPVDAEHPQVATWEWTAPEGNNFRLSGHWCVVAFVHSAASPLSETSNIVDELVSRNLQVGQKNLHIGARIPQTAGGGGADAGGGRPSGVPRDSGADTPADLMLEYVEFHNPTSNPREVSIRIDGRNLPPKLLVSAYLPDSGMPPDIAAAVSGVAEIRSYRDDDPELPPGYGAVVLDGASSSLIEVREVQLPPYDYASIMFSVRPVGELPAGSVYRLEVQQWGPSWKPQDSPESSGIGGSTYIVRVAGESPIERPDPDEPHEERRVPPMRFFPEWIAPHFRARNKERGKLASDLQVHKHLHTAKESNIDRNWTVIDHPLANDNPDAILLATPNWSHGVYNNHHIGVWFEPTQRRWAVFNQDLAPMPVGADFNIAVGVPSPTLFTHLVTAENAVGNWTVLEHPHINGNPRACLIITPNYSPGGATSGNYNNAAIGVFYISQTSRWAIFNQNRMPITPGVAFNVALPDPELAWVHQARTDNISANWTALDETRAPMNPDAILLATPNWNPEAELTGVYNDHPIGLWFQTSLARWAVFNQDLAPMPVGAAFNLL